MLEVMSLLIIMLLRLCPQSDVSNRNCWFSNTFSKKQKLSFWVAL